MSFSPSAASHQRGVTPAPNSRRKSSRTSRILGDHRSESKKKGIESEETAPHLNPSTPETSYSIHSGKKDSSVSSESVFSKSSSIFNRRTGRKEKEYYDRIGTDISPQSETASISSSKNLDNKLSDILSTQSERVNSVLSRVKESKSNKLQSPVNQPHSKYPSGTDDSEFDDSEMRHQRVDNNKHFNDSNYRNRDALSIREEDLGAYRASEESNLSDIHMRPSSFFPFDDGAEVDWNYRSSRSSDASDAQARSNRSSNSASGTSRMEASVAKVLQRLADVDEVESQNNSSENSRSPLNKEKGNSSETTNQSTQMDGKNQCEDSYYNRIRASSVSAYNNNSESNDDDSSSGSEYQDQLGSIPEIFHANNSFLKSSRDDEEEACSNSDLSLSDDGKKNSDEEGNSPGAATGRAMRPTKKNRPVRKKPPPKPPVNPLACNSESSNSLSPTLGIANERPRSGGSVSGGLRRLDNGQNMSISGGLRRLDDNQHGNASSSRVSGGLRRLEGGNKDSSLSFIGRSMLKLKMLTGNNAASNASTSSLAGNTNVSPNNVPPPQNNSNHGGSRSNLFRPLTRKSTSQSLLSTDAGETVYSVNTLEMKNPRTFLNTTGISDRSLQEASTENAQKVESSTRAESPVKSIPEHDDNKKEKFQRMQQLKKQQSSVRSNLSRGDSLARSPRRTESMALLKKKANQLETGNPHSKSQWNEVTQSQHKKMGRKGSAMIMNMQGVGMNMTAISKNLGRTVSSKNSFTKSSAEKMAQYSKLPSGSHSRSFISQAEVINELEEGTDEGDEESKEVKLPKGDEKVMDDDEEFADDVLLELDCGPDINNPVLSYKQAQRVRAFHMPGLICIDTMTLIQHPLNSKFGWFEFPFRRIFAKDPPQSDMVIEKYGIGVILWFRFLKAFAIVFTVMFVLNLPAMNMFYHGTYYPAARTDRRIENSPTDILSTTTMGNLGVQIQHCFIANPGESVHVDCAGGVVDNIIAYYGTPSGSCNCPSVQQPKKNGNCPGDKVYNDDTDELECSTGRYDRKLACFESTYRRQQCCAFSLDESGEPDLSELDLEADYSCNSLTAQYIASGTCLGKEKCTLYADNDRMYHWAGDLATNLNNSDVCQYGYDSATSANATTSFCNTTMGYSGIWDSCPDPSTRNLKVKVKCTEKDIVAFGAHLKRENIVICASILNAVAISTFIFAIFWVSKQQEAEEAEMDRSTCRATDYTVRCTRLPDHTSSHDLAKNLKRHFESKLSKCKPCFLPGKVRVADINLTTGSFQYLQAAIKRGKASRDLDLVRFKKSVMDYLDEEKSWRYKFFEKWEEYALRSFEKHNQTCLRKFLASLNGKKKVIIAYVTFETEEGFLRALENNIPIQGKHMFIRQAEDPSDILWENLGTPVLQRMTRRFFTTFLLIVLLLTTYFIVAYAIEQSENNSTDWPFIISCDDYYISLDRDDNSTELNVITYQKTIEDHKWQYFNNTEGRQGYVNCYCEEVASKYTLRRALDYNFLNPELNQYERWCKELIWDEFTLLIIKLGVSLVVLAVNLSAKTILHVMKEFERMASYSLISQSMTVKLFMIQIVNTGMLALLMNGDAGLSKNNAVAFLNGEYDDFTPEWYDDIGRNVLQTVFVYSIGVHLVKFAVHWLHQFMRWRDRGFGSDIRITKQVSQENLNKLYIGPEFIIEVRYATVLTVCFVCVAYAPAMPLLYLIAGLGFWATYLIDKWFFLRVYRIPQATSPQLAHSVTKSFYISAILNLLLSIWIYSNILLFDPDTSAEKKYVFVDNLKFLEIEFSFHAYDTISERIFSPYAYASWVVLIPFLVFLLGLAISMYMKENGYTGGAIISKILNLISTERMFEGNPPYFNVIPATVLVRRLEEGVARPHILAAYEERLRRVEVEGEEEKLLEGLESYKIELNEIYADKIALNSDYMTQVRPLDLFPQEDECEAISMEMEDDATVDSSPALPNGKLQSDQPDMRRAMPRRTISRSRTIGRGLSGADYDWEDDDVSPSASPSPNTPEKDLLTLLREKKDALKAWKEKKRREKERRKGEKDKERSSKGECKQLSEDEGHSEGESDSSDASASVAGRADSRDLAAAHEKEYYDMSEVMRGSSRSPPPPLERKSSALGRPSHANPLGRHRDKKADKKRERERHARASGHASQWSHEDPASTSNNVEVVPSERRYYDMSKSEKNRDKGSNRRGHKDHETKHKPRSKERDRMDKSRDRRSSGNDDLNGEERVNTPSDTPSERKRRKRSSTEKKRADGSRHRSRRSSSSGASHSRSKKESQLHLHDLSTIKRRRDSDNAYSHQE